MLPEPLKKFLWPLLTTITTAAIVGIIGNRADNLLMSNLWPFFQSSSLQAFWLVILGSLVIGVPLGLIALKYYLRLQSALNLIKLDDSLLRLMASISQDPNQQGAVSRLFEEFFIDALELFKDGCRISIFTPDPKDPNFLRIWQSYRVPPETIERVRLYIGDSPNNNLPKGIAGLVYKEKSLVIVHLDWQDLKGASGNAGSLKADNPNYHTFSTRCTKKSQSHWVVAGVPILDNSNNCLGVLCLDSKNREAFDSQIVQEGIDSLANRVAAIMVILDSGKLQSLTYF
jgi:hypothetical protein